ncbi:CaiB/BaiF CoA transferase family protein [Actinomadura rifamycini]|uniref:CaiB/BaiF CoA transferase family protein n=1 Tax=Actinomadura rifamycini TaxID=31962 RepID=UPI000A068A84|nr:CoA transferase [Actinomadura rifamycini]
MSPAERAAGPPAPVPQAPVFDGVRVLEVAQWTFAPAAAAVLADFGASVIKIEDPVAGDPQRGLASSGVVPSFGGVNIVTAQTNRGKRSVGLNLRDPRGRGLLMELVDRADVFVTNFRGPARKRLGFDEDAVRARNPRIVYARATGQGPRGEDADRGGYDFTSYWMRGGIASALTAPDADRPLPQPPAFGDKAGAMNLAFGIAAALFRRERTGEGALVDVSLLGTALWQHSSAILYSWGLEREFPVQSGRSANPIARGYRTSDGRWIALMMIESDRWWPGLCRHVDRPDLVDDERFADAKARTANYDACVAELESVFAARALADWRRRFAGFEAPWEVLRTMRETADDPQVAANGYAVPVDHDGTEVRLMSAPVQFDERVPDLTRAPEHAEHSEQVLLELGYDWEAILALKDAAVL